MAVDRERRGRVEIVTLNRPEARNALDRATIAGITGALADAEKDDGIAAVIITGAGEKVFCAGMDLKEFASGNGVAGDRETMDRYLAYLKGGFPKPLIAAVNGSAVAGGLELAMGCDLIVAAEHAVFGVPEVKRGLVAAGGGLLLPLRVPRAVALELGLTGDPIDARRAYELGLVNRVVPAAAVMDEAIALAARIGENGPLAVMTTKRVMHEIATFGGADAWERMTATSPAIFASQDALEGATAFAEKRTPHWTGR